MTQLEKRRLICSVCSGLSVFLSTSGCATIRKEKYHIPSDHVYHREFGADAETVFKATRDALVALGWKIAEQEIVQDITHPLTEEARQYYGWIYTSGRITSYLLAWHGETLNVHIKPLTGTTTDVEVAYLKAWGFLDQESQAYRNDEYVTALYDAIQAKF